MAGLIKTGGARGGDDVGTGGGRKLRRCLKVSEDQAEAASFHTKERQRKPRWRREVEEGYAHGRQRTAGRDESQG